MHVCLLMPGYPPENHSWGIGTYAKNLVAALTHENHRCTVVSRSLNQIATEDTGRYGEHIIRIPTNISFNNTYPIDLSDFAKRIVPIINTVYKKKQFDILLVADWGGEACFILEAEKEYPVVVTLHTPSFMSEKWNPEAPPYLSVKTKKLEKELLYKAKYVLAPNKEILDIYASFLNPEAIIKICRFPTIVDEAIDNTVNISMDNNNLIITCAGRVENRKGQQILLEALEKFCSTDVIPWHLYLIGPDTPKNNGTYIQWLKKNMSFELKRKVTFTGALEHSHVIKYFASSYLVVVPSLFESFGYVATEALSQGIPVVASCTGGLKDIIIDKFNGILVEPGNPKQLGNTIYKLLTDKTLYLQLRENTYKDFLKRLSMNIVAFKYSSILSEFIYG